jgi:hypothetical protein
LSTGTARAYVEVPYTLGKVVKESTNIVLVEVTRVNQERGLILYKKLKDTPAHVLPLD